MVWGFRKSFGSKAFRVNLSKSGIGFSTGVKGFRVSTSSRGTFVNMGAGGIYYRQKIGGANRRARPTTSKQGASTHQYTQQGPQTMLGGVQIGTLPSADAAQLVDQNSIQLLNSINDSIRQPGALGIVLLIATLTTAIATVAAPIMLTICAMLWVVPLIIVARADQRARTYSLLYELDPVEQAKWADLQSRLKLLASSQSIWRVAAVVSTPDWKRNGGAEELMTRFRVSLTPCDAPLISSNITPWCLRLNDQQLYFFPDRLLVLKSRQYGALDYDHLMVTTTLEDFVETGVVPKDSQVIGSTYAYVNKDGSPDRRFSNNRQIPIVRYSRLIFRSGSGLNIHLHVSSQSSGQAFHGWKHHGSVYNSPPSSKTASPNSSNFNQSQSQTNRTQVAYGTRTANPQTPDCYTKLGVPIGCSRDEASTAYRALARRYHPDLLNGLPSDLRAIAQERLKEVNIAWSELKKLRGW